jgi:hypothetical protein
MATRQTSSRSLKSIAGAAALSFGVLVLFVNLDGLAARLPSAIGNPSAPLSPLPALGLAGLHAAQAYTFDRAGFLSSLQQILLSFWPLILIILGAVLLRDAFWGRLAPFKASVGSSAMGDH